MKLLSKKSIQHFRKKISKHVKQKSNLLMKHGHRISWTWMTTVSQTTKDTDTIYQIMIISTKWVGHFFLENKYAQTIKDTFSQTIKTTKHKTNSNERDDRKEYVNINFNEFSGKNINGKYSRYTSRGAVFVERFNKTKRNLIRKLVFEKWNGNWLVELPAVLKK